MKKMISALTLTAGLLLGAQANAVIIDASTVIPDENILLNFNGLDWVYAGPIATEEWGPGNIEAPEYRADEGWRYATQTEWDLRPDWTDFIIGGAAVDAVAGFSDHSVYRFASEYWGNFNHIDLSDAAEGRLTNGYDIGSLYEVYETWYVRDARITTPVPESSTIILFGLGLLGLVFTRRKHSK
ncbi:MAG TPA: PEP-CTERM sorting domain-containing protein [Cellvibrio sp.]|nr:PEP-CTERM sorting domain-containing protein [Cellvibrio sp.]